MYTLQWASIPTLFQRERSLKACFDLKNIGFQTLEIKSENPETAKFCAPGELLTVTFMRRWLYFAYRGRVSTRLKPGGDCPFAPSLSANTHLLVAARHDVRHTEICQNDCAYSEYLWKTRHTLHENTLTTLKNAFKIGIFNCILI